MPLDILREPEKLSDDARTQSMGIPGFIPGIFLYIPPPGEDFGEDVSGVVRERSLSVARQKGWWGCSGGSNQAPREGRTGSSAGRYIPSPASNDSCTLALELQAGHT